MTAAVLTLDKAQLCILRTLLDTLNVHLEEGIESCIVGGQKEPSIFPRECQRDRRLRGRSEEFLIRIDQLLEMMDPRERGELETGCHEE